MSYILYVYKYYVKHCLGRQILQKLLWMHLRASQIRGREPVRTPGMEVPGACPQTPKFANLLRIFGARRRWPPPMRTSEAACALKFVL